MAPRGHCTFSFTNRRGAPGRAADHHQDTWVDRLPCACAQGAAGRRGKYKTCRCALWPVAGATSQDEQVAPVLRPCELVIRVYRPGYWLPLDVRGGTWRAGENTPKSIQLLPNFEPFFYHFVLGISGLFWMSAAANAVDAKVEEFLKTYLARFDA